MRFSGVRCTVEARAKEVQNVGLGRDRKSRTGPVKLWALSSHRKRGTRLPHGSSISGKVKVSRFRGFRAPLASYLGHPEA